MATQTGLNKPKIGEENVNHLALKQNMHVLLEVYGTVLVMELSW
jgi:hypothetical protein